MSTSPIVTIGQIKDMGFRGIDGLSDSLMDLCAVAATDAIQLMNEPFIYIAPAAAGAESYDGARAHGDYAEWISLDQRPIISIISVTEDGTALTFGSDYTAYNTKDVYVDMARGKLRRNGSLWSPGYANIVVTYRAGYATEQDVPSDLKMAAGALAILFYRASGSIGIQSAQRGASSVGLIYELPDIYQQVILRYGPTGRTRCR